MYDVFRQYYAYTDMDSFIRDLNGKHGAILIRTRGENRVVGFSTIVSLDMAIGRMRARGVFSGDTIIEREYWGTRTLQIAFFLYVLKEKLRKPFRPLFWLLISKGYKTFLLLANNFHQYYPHPDGDCPELAPVVRHYCERLFPGHYDPDTGVLDFGENAQHLKEDVASITPELRQQVPKVRFFEERNPTWRRGTELPCVGEITLKTLMGFVLKAGRGGRSRADRQPIPATPGTSPARQA
ncbi:hypothetical protein [Marinobacter halodurans]|nr:hypothetical protein [Marinobacter halodurans]